MNGFSQRLGFMKQNFENFKWQRPKIKYLTDVSQGYFATEESFPVPHSRHSESLPKRDSGSRATRVSEG